MDNQISLYDALSSAYNVARVIADHLEHEYLQGIHDAHKLEILSGCYTVTDFFANHIAKFGLEEANDDYTDPFPEIADYAAAAELMKAYAEILERDLTSDEMPSFVDYRKVHALVGLRIVCQYIESRHEDFHRL